MDGDVRARTHARKGSMARRRVGGMSQTSEGSREYDERRVAPNSSLGGRAHASKHRGGHAHDVREGCGRTDILGSNGAIGGLHSGMHGRASECKGGRSFTFVLWTIEATVVAMIE